MTYSSVSSTIQLCLIAICTLTVPTTAQKHHRLLKDMDPKLISTEVFAPIGGQAVLECVAAGTPGPLIHWLRNGQRIYQGGLEEDLSREKTEVHPYQSKLNLSSTKSRLVIDCVSAVDAGLYVCVAETPTKRVAIDYTLKVETQKVSRVRRHLGKRHLEKHHLDKHNLDKHLHKGHRTQAGASCFKNQVKSAQLSARIYMWTVFRVEVEGADIQLYCRPTGSGSVKVTWFDRNDKEITIRNPRYEVLETGDLLVKSINWAEDMGQYRCLVENKFGTDAIETFVYPLKIKCHDRTPGVQRCTHTKAGKEKKRI